MKLLTHRTPKINNINKHTFSILALIAYFS